MTARLGLKVPHFVVMSNQSTVEMEMTARLGLKAQSTMAFHSNHRQVEMEMTARLGLKDTGEPPLLR